MTASSPNTTPPPGRGVCSPRTPLFGTCSGCALRPRREPRTGVFATCSPPSEQPEQPRTARTAVLHGGCAVFATCSGCWRQRFRHTQTPAKRGTHARSNEVSNEVSKEQQEENQ